MFGGVRAPSTLGTFLRTFTVGQVRQLDAVAARMLARLATVSPLLPGAEVLAFLDVDDTVKATYGDAKQDAGYGYTGVKGLNALIATVSSPLAAPLIVGTRLGKGSVNSARGTGLVIVRADSAFYGYPVIAAARRAGAHLSVTVRASPAVSRAIESIAEDAGQPIHYPNAVWDEQAHALVSDADMAEAPFTAFTAFTAFTGRRRADFDGRTLAGAGFALSDPDLAGYALLDFEAFDSWLEEDEPNVGHPVIRFHRIDVVASSRSLLLELDGAVLAETSRPTLLFETFLPTRYYVPREDIVTDLVASQTVSTCAYKGQASYWSSRMGDDLVPDVAWSYEEPLHDGARVRGLVAFFDERVDVILDGNRRERPMIHWSR